MRKIYLLFPVLLPSIILTSVYVPGHTDKNGTYVPPHYATNPDNQSVRADNWSNNKGVYNPYTGKNDTNNKDIYDNNNNTIPNS